MIAPIELRLGDHGIPFADEGGDRSPAAEFAQDSGSAVNDGLAEVFPRPGLLPASGGRAGGLYSAI